MHNFRHMHPSKIHFRLGICTVWSEYSLGTIWIGKDAKFLHVDNEDWSDCADMQGDLILHWVHMSEGFLMF